jgi:hypothetical protein
MIPFIAFAVLMVSSSFYNFHHQVKSHKQPVIVNQEDPTLKAKGINLPGYNHEPQTKNETP